MTETQIIYIINASSRTDTGITENIASSLAWMNVSGLPEIRCITLSEGPAGINNARDSDVAAPAVLKFIERESPNSKVAGFVVACFTDPGVYAARTLTSKPVVGIGEAGFYTALCLGDRIGTLGVAAGKGAKTLRIARTLGVLDRVAGHKGLGLDYGELKDPKKVLAKLIAAGKALRDEDGVEALLFAAAGLADYVKPLEAAVGLPVIDPTSSAASMVLSQVMQTRRGI